MQKYTVVAEVNFEVYDEDEFKAQRQAMVALLRFVGDPVAEGYNDEYADLPTISVLPVKTTIYDENGKFVAGDDPNFKPEPENNAE